jgi:hypothetical protein
MIQKIAILRAICAAAVLGFAGCAASTFEPSTPKTGYVVGSTYVTKIDLPADVFGDGLNGHPRNVQFLRNADVDPSGGRIELIGKGTRIRVSQVLVQESADLGSVTRIFATVASGPYVGSMANLYGISVQQRSPDGRMGALALDPAVLGPVN